MDKNDLIDQLLAFCKNLDGIESASRIAGEDVIGVELTDGSEYFIEIQPA